MAIPIITDTHFGSRSFQKNVFDTMMDFFEKEFFPYCLKHNIRDVIHLGDIVHNRNVIDLFILQELKRRFFKWFEDNNVRLHVLVGNHDSYYRNTIATNFLNENVNEFDNIVVYDAPKVIEIDNYKIHMVPWIVDEKLFVKETADILCGHFDIIGMPMLKNIYSQDGFKSEDFKEYKMVLSGHYHLKSNNKNITYPGTQYQLSWSDYDEDKGFFVLGEKCKLKFISNTVNPRYVKVFYTEIDGEVRLKVAGLAGGKVTEISGSDAVKIAKANYVRLITDKVKDQSELDNIYNSMMLVSKNNYKIEIINSNEIIESFDFEEIESDIEGESDLFTTISAYVAGMKFEDSVDKSKLISIMKQLYKEVSEDSKDA